MCSIKLKVMEKVNLKFSYSIFLSVSLAKDNEALNYCSRSPPGEFLTFSNYRENLKIMDKERTSEVLK